MPIVRQDGYTVRIWKICKTSAALALTLALSWSQACRADPPNYHIVGWTNAVVPGGGQYLLGHPLLGAVQTTLEAGTFLWGYSLSRRSPFTLDGVPEDLPLPSAHVSTRRTIARVCTINPRTHKTTCSNEASISSTFIPSSTVDITKSLYADWLQEFGLKYHMVNIFNSYREAAGPDSAIGDQKIDQTPTTDLFLAPFKWDNVSSLWVFPAVIVTAAALIFTYQTASNDGSFGQISPLDKGSQRLYDTTYLGILPVGSGAPEEMFYRGFVQHELYGLVQSAVFSVGVSTALFAFSHSTDDRPSAAVSGAYEGIVTHVHHGELSKAIAYHFWADVLAGFYQIAVVRKESGKHPLLSFDFKF
jgi:hypothetical protein